MNKQLNCVVIDDEPLAQDLIEKFINRVPFLTFKEKFSNAIDAINGIDIIKPDIIFLDINMPEMTGIEFLKTFSTNRPQIIMTTAYPQYALDGFEYDVADYLLKPIAFDRFIKAINKVKDKFIVQTPTLNLEPQAIKKENPDTNNEPPPSQDGYILVKEDKKLVRINLTDIIFIEGMKDYIKIHLATRVIVTHMTMSKIDSILKSIVFLRINRSFIININSIKNFEGNMIETINNKKLTIGINYRDIVRNAFKSKII